MKPTQSSRRAVRAAPVRKPFTVSWIVAGILVVLGAALLGFSIFQMTRKPEAQQQPVADKEVQRLQAQLETAEAELAATKEKNKPARTEYQTLAADNKEMAERTKARETKIKEHEAFNRKRITDAQRKLESIKNREEQDTASADKLAAQRAETEKQLQKFQEDVVKLREAVVTITSSGGTIGTGFIYAGPDGPLVITINDVAPADAQLAVRVRTSADGKKPKTSTLKARVLLADKDTALSILSLEKTDDIKGMLFDENFIRDGLAGERVYEIATQVIEDKPMEFSIFDGTISATNRKHAKRTVLQVALPFNTGSLGAPLITADLKLVGIMLGTVEDLERTSVAVPAKDLLKAIERLPKKR